MRNTLKTWLSAGVGLAIALGLAGCLPFPLGDPAKSKVDPKLCGYWMNQTNEDRDLIAMFPFDDHAYVLEDLKLKKEGDKWQPQGAPVVYKAWLTEVKGQRFLTLDPLVQRLPNPSVEQKAYPLARLTAAGDAIVVRMVSGDADLLKNVKSAADVEAVITKELNNPDIYSGEGSKFRRVDPEADKELLAPLVNS